MFMLYQLFISNRKDLRMEDCTLNEKVVSSVINFADVTTPKEELLASNSSTSLIKSNPTLSELSNSTTASSDATLTFSLSNAAKTPVVSNTTSAFTFSNPFIKLSSTIILPDPTTSALYFSKFYKPTTSSAFTFPNSTTTTNTSMTTTTSTATTTSTFSSPTATAFAFSSPTATTTSTFSSPTATAFAFSSPTATTTSTFSNPTATAFAFSSPTTTAFAFCNTTTTGFTFSNPTKPAFTFGNPSTTGFTFSNPTTPAFTFGNPTTTGFTFSNPTTTTFTNPTSTVSSANTTHNEFHFGKAETCASSPSPPTEYDTVKKQLEELKERIASRRRAILRVNLKDTVTEEPQTLWKMKKFSNEEELLIEDAKEIVPGKPYHWRDWSIVFHKGYLYLWSDAVVLQFWELSAGWFHFIRDGKIAKMSAVAAFPENGTDECKIEIVKHLQAVRQSQMETGSPSQPILSVPGTSHLVIGRWSLFCNTDGEISVHHSILTELRIVLKEDLPGFIFESVNGNKRLFTAERSLGLEFPAGWAKKEGKLFNPKYKLKYLNQKHSLQTKDTPLFVEASTQTGEELRDSKLLQGLKEMLLNSKHSDFVLNVKGMEFRVHKLILEAHSPVFAAMLEHDTKEKADGIANIDDCEPHTMTKFLNFLYTERVDLNSEEALDLYEVADKYQVMELRSICIKYMKNNISIENFCDILTLSLRHHVRELTEAATQLFLLNSTEIAVTAKWQAFLIENPVAGNELFLKALKLERNKSFSVNNAQST